MNERMNEWINDLMSLTKFKIASTLFFNTFKIKL